MNTVRVTKIFTFEMAHALRNYDGICRNIHGHSYVLHVTLKGKPLVNDESPKNGMVIDFGILKDIVNKNIVNRLDHAIMLHKDTCTNFSVTNEEIFCNKVIVDFQPTCENMVIDFAKKIIPALPQGITLERLRLYETANSYAEWLAVDN